MTGVNLIASQIFAPVLYESPSVLLVYTLTYPADFFCGDAPLNARKNTHRVIGAQLHANLRYFYLFGDLFLHPLKLEKAYNRVNKEVLHTSKTGARFKCDNCKKMWS